MLQKNSTTFQFLFIHLFIHLFKLN
uniref:Uncharacterized protein n=1 Tax=Heterorhabditis bacteriophora TaxID=37862 RepID=A0A1I7WFA3_HETBA